MKRINRWLARICMAAVLLGAAGLENLPAKAAEEAPSPLKIEAPENKVQTYQCGEPQDFVLNITNTGTEKVTDIVVSPILKDRGADWPFVTDYQKYVQELPELDAGSVGSVKFNFTQRDDAGAERYQLTFKVTANVKTVDEDGKPSEQTVATEESFYVNTSAKQEEPAQSEPVAGGFDTGSAAYVGGGSGSSGNGSVPRVIVTGFTTNPAEVKAGSDFVLTVQKKQR